MKNVLIIILLLSFFSCRKISKTPINEILVKGEWKVSKYTLEGEDKINNVSKYTFVFFTGDSLHVLNSFGNIEDRGTWTTSKNGTFIDAGVFFDFDWYFESFTLVASDKDDVEFEYSKFSTDTTDYLSFTQK